MMTRIGHTKCMKDIECMKILPRNLNGTFGRIWEDDIKMVLKDIGCTLVDWINLAKNKVQWRVVVKGSCGHGYFFEKLIFTHRVKNYPAFFMEAEGSLQCSQKPATVRYPEPAESSSPHRSLRSIFCYPLTCP
jgi:hypothetical protein